jgi:hypothetical protein
MKAMKKILKLSLVCAVLFTGMSTYANDGIEDSGLHVLKNNGKQITFALNQAKRANLAIYEKDGTLIYTETASGKEGILRTFNLEQFPTGTYFLEVIQNGKSAKHEITITDQTSVLSSKAIFTTANVAAR